MHSRSGQSQQPPFPLEQKLINLILVHLDEIHHFQSMIMHFFHHYLDREMNLLSLILQRWWPK